MQMFALFSDKMEGKGKLICEVLIKTDVKFFFFKIMTM